LFLGWANHLAAALTGNSSLQNQLQSRNLLTLCGAPKQQINVESGFLFSRKCPVLLTFFLPSQVLPVMIFICSGWLASKNQSGIEEHPALKLPVQISIPFDD
jgi:hypothetical protein